MSGHYGFEMRANYRSTYNNPTLPKAQKVEANDKAIAQTFSKPILKVKLNEMA